MQDGNYCRQNDFPVTVSPHVFQPLSVHVRACNMWYSIYSKEGKRTHRRGRNARSNRKTRRMPKIRGLEAADSETTTSTSEMKTRKQSITFQPLRKYECESNAKPLDSTFHNTRHRLTTVIQKYRLYSPR